MTEPVVLVVDDEIEIRRFLRAGLELQNFRVYEAENAQEALRCATLRPVDLIVVDLGLPDLDGAEIVERVRSWSKIPIIVLSIRSSEEEKVRLLEIGADDYVVKPFGMAELLARARAALRRTLRSPAGEPVVRIGELVIDLATRTISLSGRRIQLSAKEYRLLQVLAQHAGSVVTHQQLLREIWGVNMHEGHHLRVLVRKLRHKLEQDPADPRILVTELGIGYRLSPDNQ
jgi:two-component system KDP operon response regulator KdpE